MTRSWDDEKIAELVERAGLEGYGFYFRLLEIVAANIEESSDAVVTYSLQRWSKLTAIFQPKVLRLCRVCSELDLIEFQLSANLLKVSIPKIFKYRDEHTRKQAKLKPKTPESLRSHSGQTPEQELDTDIDTEADLDTDTEVAKKMSDTPLNLPTANGEITKDKKLLVEFQNAMGAFSLSEREKMNVTLLIDVGCKPEDVKAARAKNPDYVKSFKSEYAMRQINAARQIRVGEIKTDAPFDAMTWLANYNPESEDAN